MPTHFETLIDQTPTCPGVYMMLDKNNTVLYIGKAKNIRSRLQGYKAGRDGRAFVQLLESQVARIEVSVTQNEKEALILENTLIKAKKPRYNIKLRDDANYLCIKLTTSHTFPRIEAVRGITRGDKNRYFGPFHSAQSIRKTVNLLNKYFGLRTCSDQVLNQRKHPCMQYHMKRCPAPCVFKPEPPEAYQQSVEQVIAFLEGRHKELKKNIEDKMLEASENLHFEKAAKLRDQILAIEKSLVPQTILHQDLGNRDVIGNHITPEMVVFSVSQFREGKCINVQIFKSERSTLPLDEILSSFATSYIQALKVPPPEILLPKPSEWAEGLNELLNDVARERIKILTPERGEKKKYVLLACANAKAAWQFAKESAGATEQTLQNLQETLGLKNFPDSLECYDISHFDGESIVASQVRFDQGRPNKKGYRHYKIKSLTHQDDFQSIREVIGRRLKRGLEKGELPALILIDGGKGQLHAAREAFDLYGIDNIDLISIAKVKTGSKKKHALHDFERIFTLEDSEAIILEPTSPLLLLLTQARDEAHRFALAQQRKGIRKARSRSVLEDIPGIGPKTRAKLLKHFGSVKRIQGASFEALKAISNEKISTAIKDHFKD